MIVKPPVFERNRSRNEEKWITFTKLVIKVPQSSSKATQRVCPVVNCLEDKARSLASNNAECTIPKTGLSHLYLSEKFAQCTSQAEERNVLAPLTEERRVNYAVRESDRVVQKFGLSCGISICSSL